MRLRITPSSVIAVGAVFVAMSGTAVAANGGSLVLGRSNSATSTTTLSDSKDTPLALSGPKSEPPLKVNSSKKVAKLNADLVDGLDSAKLQARVTGTCVRGF